MCHLPLSNKGWLRQLRPNVRPKAIRRFETLVHHHQSGRPECLTQARFTAFKEMGFCDVE
ncbi:hypothetical protein PL263_10485 [Methylomonas sp. EFPC3]|uniref:hypothetical protein n=1 Tax=Methylomonas sp. EFPC3 TaxID=3021710 RepID=UPI0024176439|nr:hypothetical protein [Methylomonas sp. EFPC3]WFP48540.1 hypothetical protein PL263_10485 [Methylomonas sp. EFPC3]